MSRSCGPMQVVVALLLSACAPAATPPDSAPAPTGAPASQSAVATLTGPRWNLVRLGTRTMTGLGTPNSPHLLFDGEAHRVAGSGGCNRVMGSYLQEEETLRFGPLAGTMMACAQLVMEQEEAFLKALRAVESWRIVNGQLELRGTDRQLLARFAPATRGS